MLSSSKVAKSNRAGATPGNDRRGNTPVVGSRNLGGTPIKNPRNAVPKMTLKEKLDLLKDLQVNRNSMGRSEVYKALLKLTLADDAPDPPTSTGHVLIKKIDFDAETSSASSTLDGGERQGEQHYLKLISNTLEQTESGKKLCWDLHEAMLVSQFSENVQIGKLMDILESEVIPALEKLMKDPIRIHELIRQTPPENAIPCRLEDQEEFVENFKKLSENCNQLRTFFLNESASQFDLQAQLTTLESIAEGLDSTLSFVAAEKIKFQKLQARMVELDEDIALAFNNRSC